MTRFDDAAVVREQYATESNLQARQALWAEVEGENAPEALWRVLAAHPLGRVLEVGGGQGELAVRMQTELGATVTFLDQSERMVELARGRGIEDAHVGDVQSLPFADASFETVVAAWMLYHVPDLDRGLREIARVLVDGGRLVAVTNSERHIEELRDLLQYAHGSFRLTFTSENGEGLLRRRFRSVERHDAVVKAVVRSRETLVAYRDSVSVVAGRVPEDVPLPFVVHGRTTVFVATR